MDGYSSPRALSVVVMFLLGATLLVDVVSIGSGLMQIDLIERIQTGDYTEAEIASNDAREGGLGLLAMGCHFVTGIAFIVWFRRAYVNLEHFGHTPVHGRSWTFWAWVVPIISLFRPFQMTREIWHASDPDELGGGDVTSTPGLLGAWWGAFILGNIAGQIALRTSLGATTPGEIEASTMAQLAQCAITVISAPLAILVVRELTRRQDARAAGLTRAEDIARVFE